MIDAEGTLNLRGHREFLITLELRGSIDGRKVARRQFTVAANTHEEAMRWAQKRLIASTSFKVREVGE